MYEPLANRITAEFNVLLTHTFVPVAETRISILFLAKRGVEDLNLWSPFRDSVLAGQCIQPNSANTSNSPVVQYCLITTEYKQILTSIIFCLSEIIIVFSLSGQNWNRTSDTGIFSPLLYLLSYLTIHKIINSRFINFITRCLDTVSWSARHT